MMDRIASVVRLAEIAKQRADLDAEEARIRGAMSHLMPDNTAFIIARAFSSRYIGCCKWG